MSCFHPLKGFQVGFNPSGKPKYMITSYDVKYVYKTNNNDWNVAFNEICSDRIRPIVSEYIDIPCGHCIGCLLDRSRDWATRCMLEASYHEHNCFITLTYNDKYIPESREYVDINGVVKDSPYHTLQKKDFQLFMKRLRKAIDPVKIRFFACGEYGSHTFRPHYHAIIFGYDFPDRVYLKSNFRGEKYYISELLQKCWSDPVTKEPLGNILVTDISFDTCAYVARYCLKKQDNDMSLFYDLYNLDKEFTLMSRRPGIGRDYYDDNKNKIFNDGRIILSSDKDVKFLRPPKYYDKLYDIEDPDSFSEIKNKRKEFVENKKIVELSGTDLSYLEYLSVKEHDFHNRTKIFKERSKFNETP